jgi:hypothetical protein
MHGTVAAGPAPAGNALRSAVDDFERIGARFERAGTLALLPDRAREGRTELAELGLLR